MSPRGDAGPETVVWDPDAPCGDGTDQKGAVEVIEMGIDRFKPPVCWGPWGP